MARVGVTIMESYIRGVTNGYRSFLNAGTLHSCLSTHKVLILFLVPLAERSVLNIVHLRRVISSSFATSQGSWFHLFVKEATLFYLFLFRFSPVPS